ncbi:MAG: glycosyltransferase [Puniceicoccaceae bacterium 5H]|nr:MAG: glycosyltransferase [Puniceicoccaceae bacterium 5H]
MSEDSQTVLYGFCFPHHGRYSSYARLLDYLPECTVVRAEQGLPAPLYRMGFKKVRSFFWMQEVRLRSLLARYPGAVLHHIYAEATVQQGWLPRRGQYVLTVHQPPERLEEERERRQPFFAAARKAPAIIILDPAQQEAYARLFGHDRIIPIAHGIDTERFAPTQGGDRRPSNAPLEVVTVGAWLRDWESWLEIFHAATAVLPDIRFTVLSRPEIVARLRDETGNHEQFCGISGISDNELLDLYRSSDVLFLPLSGATANNALLEAASCGLAVVSTDLPALRGYLEGAHGNCWFPRREPEQAVAYLREMAVARARLSAVGCSNRQRMLDAFSWPVIADQHRKVYRSVALV